MYQRAQLRTVLEGLVEACLISEVTTLGHRDARQHAAPSRWRTGAACTCRVAVHRAPLHARANRLQHSCLRRSGSAGRDAWDVHVASWAARHNRRAQPGDLRLGQSSVTPLQVCSATAPPSSDEAAVAEDTFLSRVWIHRYRYYRTARRVFLY